MVIRGIKTFVEKFDRAQSFTTTPGHNGWTIADTSAAGTPTYLTITEDGGAAALTLSSTNEVQNVCLYQNDILMYDWAMIQSCWIVAKVANFGSASTLVFGLGSARNDTPDSVTENAQFRIEGGTSTSNIVVETDDNVTDNDDKATGATLSSTYKKCLIDFSNGLADVRFFVDGSRVAAGTTFNMSGVTAGNNCQPIFQIQKTAATNTSAITIAEFGIQFKWALGA